MTYNKNWYKQVATRKDYYNSNQFQFWNGPMPSKHDSAYREVYERVERVFHSSNIIKEIVDRQADALISQFPHWYLKDSSTSERLPEGNNQAELDLQAVWDTIADMTVSHESSHKDPLRKAVTDMLITDKGYLALYEPKRYKNSNNIFKRVGLYSPDFRDVKIHRDDDGIIEKIERFYGNNKKEVQYLNERNLLVIEIYDSEQFVQEESFITDTGGRYTVYELADESIITPSLMQAQNSINKSLTMKDLNIEVSGFLERIITNALPPGRLEDDPNNPGRQRYVPSNTPLEVGPGQTTYVQPLPIYDDTGRVAGYTSPSISYRNPVDPESFVKSLEVDMTFAYREARQSHLLSVGDGRLAGVSREHIKQDWISGLERTSKVIESALRSINSVILWRLSTLLNVDYRSYEPVVQLRLSTGKPLPEERQANRDDFQAGLLSRTTAMSLLVDDTDAEMALRSREM